MKKQSLMREGSSLIVCLGAALGCCSVALGYKSRLAPILGGDL
jgi:hypothetical protein